MQIGFTGTRRGMSSTQQIQLGLVLQGLKKHFPGQQFHFGGAVGADREARRAAKLAGYVIHWHPCPGVDAGTAYGDEAADRTALQALLADEVWHEVFPPLERNRHIVQACGILIVAPETDLEQQRSGTWATVRAARRSGTPVVMLPRGER